MSACECHFCSSSVPSNGGSHGTPTWTTNSVLLLGSSNTNQQENMLELKTMFISLDICKIWWHSAGVWSFSFCYKQQPTKAQKRELLFSCQLPPLDICLNQAVWKGSFCSFIFADMYSVNSVFHHFEKSIPVHLQHTFEEDGTGFPCAYTFIPCTQAQAEHPAAEQSQQDSSGGEKLHKEGRSYTSNRHLCGLLQPEHYHMEKPGSWLQLTIF